MLTITQLKSLVRYLPPELNVLGREYGLATMVLTRILGVEWTERRLFHPGAKPNFLQAHLPIEIDRSLDSHFDRIVNLAEMLFNLQGVAGFDAVLERLSTGDLESTFAELETGAVLLRYRVDFRFIQESRQRGQKDFDIEVTTDEGTKVAAETKARLSTSDLSSKSIYNRLNEGRQQLPANVPSFLFLRIAPNLFVPQTGTMPQVDEAVRKLFTGTRRVASVKLHTVQTIYDDINMYKLVSVKEYCNVKCRWSSINAWKIFDKDPISVSDWVSMRGVLGRPEIDLRSPTL